MAKVVVLGLDGVPWEILKPLADSGELPNFRALIEQGSRAVLETFVPPLTCPAWKFYSTGKNPAKFGVFSRTELDFEKGGITAVDSSCYKSKEIWDYVGETGKKVAVIDMPTTYPPRKVNGFMVASTEPPNYHNYTFPAGMEKDLEERLSYKPDIQTRLDVESKELEQEVYSLIETRFAILQENLQKADFLHLTIVFTDYLMHFYWDKGIARKAFKKIDECLGKLVEKAGKGCCIIVFSDHGFAKMKARFFANRWLQQQGMLFTKEAVGNALFRAGINRELVLGFLRKLGLEKIARKIVPGSMGKKLKSKHGFVGGEEASSWLDWRKSKVVCNANDLFFINPAIRGKEREKLGRGLKEKLAEVRFPPTGETIFEKVFLKEELYNGPFMEKAPDVVTLSRQWFEACSALGSKGLFETGGRWIGIHARDGIFIAKGPAIRQGFDAGRASILDLAPTILHLMKVPLPGDFDGRVLREIFKQ